MSLGSYNIDIFQCAKCQHIFVTRKDLINHKCSIQSGNHNKFTFNEAKTTKCLLELIAINKYSFLSIESPAFQRFLDSFGRAYTIPSADKISRLMLEYAGTIQKKNLDKLKNTIVW